MHIPTCTHVSLVYANNYDDCKLSLSQKSKMTDPTQMTDISSKPSHSSPDTPDTSSTDGQDHTSLLTHKRLKKFYILGVPILSLLVGGALLLIEVVIIILVLADPEALGIAEDVALTAAQRGVLGAVSIVMLIEAVILGVIDIGTILIPFSSILQKTVLPCLHI